MIFANKETHSNKFGIYLIINNVNGRTYVGSTTTSFRKRFATHKSSLNKPKGSKGVHNNTFMYNDYQLNKGAFIFIPFEIVNNKEKVLEREQIIIDAMYAGVPHLAYNLRKNVADTRHSNHSVDRKRQQSDIMKAKWQDPIWRKEYMDNYTPRKLADWEVEQIRNRNLGKKLPREQVEKQKTSLANSFSKSVLCIETGKQYRSVSDCAKDMKLCRRSIGKVCSGECRQHHNYTFKFIPRQTQLPL